MNATLSGGSGPNCAQVLSPKGPDGGVIAPAREVHVNVGAPFSHSPPTKSV